LTYIACIEYSRLIMRLVTRQILIVDDNDMHLLLISKVLAMEGFQVLTAHNADEAVKSIIESQPDMAIIDVLMPGINGYDLCRILRKPPYELQIPIVMLTAMRGEAERILAKEAGANGVWSKPFDIDTVRNEIEILLRDSSG
jgi:DNA-binding response OmpR family regulator